MRRISTLLATFIIIAGCTPAAHEQQSTSSEEIYRPHYHFTPEKNWMNDPNGLVYVDGEYHLFYQYNPFDNVWGHMSWGHAVSKDLLRWEHLPVAIREYQDPTSGDSTMIFSGSAVYDKNNTSGFFTGENGGLVAVYTSHVHKNNEGILQHESLAYSSDKGRTFITYPKNPVLDKGLKDFRDPKVFWYAPENKWVMVLVVPDKFKAELYESKDLKAWSYMSEFGHAGDSSRIWECPDLVKLHVKGNENESKWALLISGPHPAGKDFVGMQYFIGDFDGKTFTADTLDYPLWLDYGKDFYAGVTYNNVPDTRNILVGWANNWAYGQTIPTSPWRSAMNLPRELYITDTGQGFRIIQQPIKEAEGLRETTIDDFTAGNFNTVELTVSITTEKTAGIELIAGDSSKVIIGYDNNSQEVYMDRRHSGDVDFHPLFSSIERAPVATKGKVTLHIFIDQSIIEVFINDGEKTIAEQVFNESGFDKITTFSDESSSVILKGWKLNSIHNGAR